MVKNRRLFVNFYRIRNKAGFKWAKIRESQQKTFLPVYFPIKGLLSLRLQVAFFHAPIIFHSFNFCSKLLPAFAGLVDGSVTKV
jgi:hypothetical protein